MHRHSILTELLRSSYNSGRCKMFHNHVISLYDYKMCTYFLSPVLNQSWRNVYQYQLAPLQKSDVNHKTNPCARHRSIRKPERTIGKNKPLSLYFRWSNSFDTHMLTEGIVKSLSHICLKRSNYTPWICFNDTKLFFGWVLPILKYIYSNTILINMLLV